MIFKIIQIGSFLGSTTLVVRRDRQDEACTSRSGYAVGRKNNFVSMLLLLLLLLLMLLQKPDHRSTNRASESERFVAFCQPVGEVRGALCPKAGDHGVDVVYLLV